jgi:L-methionine (R)-S-oxide reductase
MYEFTVETDDKPTLYRDLIAAADALTAGEPDPIANMANVAALLWQYLPNLNWAGFYRVGRQGLQSDGELILGPFQGKPACIRIAYGSGVCGMAVTTLQPVRVDDVHAFPGHIACDAASASELVIPLIAGTALVGVIDLDSPIPGRFDEEDVAGCVALAALIANRVSEG